MAYIFATVEIGDAERHARWTVNALGPVPRSRIQWQTGRADGYFRKDHADEAAARAEIASRLRQWADQIEKLPFPKRKPQPR